jgi:hypothetical protein
MDIYEITGYKTGVSREGVNFLDPADAFETILNGYIYRQVLQSRKGFVQFGNRLSDGTRVMGIFEHILPDSTRQTLVCSKNFLYRYNTVTNVFDQIPMAGAAPVLGFGITDSQDYVSGTTYPFANGNQRFVFTGRGMSDVYFYDGTNVKSYTTLADNPNYVQPPQGALTRALHVIWFGERINFFAPFIGGQNYPQGILYSGIRDASGNGDKFNIPGSGLLEADTYELLKGASILGTIIAVNFSRSNWTLEKTRDPFNPYFIRKVPSVIGTDAAFSFASWYDQTVSIGKTGIISTDGRESLRIDNKLPYFTQDEINSTDFELTYGGFERNNSQFMFAYRSSDSNIADTQNKVLVNNYEENTWSVYDQRFSCFGQSTLGQNLTWDEIYEANNPSWARWDTTEEVWDRIGIGSEVQKTLAGDDLGFVYELNVDYDDYVVAVTGIVAGVTTTININPAAFQVGDKISIRDVLGMTEINDDVRQDNEQDWPIVLSKTVTSITINVNSTGFSAWTSGGIVSKVISFYAEMSPFNPYRSSGCKCYVSHVEFLLDTDDGHLLVDVYEDEEESPFISNVLIEPTNLQKAREWITMTVNQEANFITFVLKQESASVQVRQTSMRIHCSRGGLTSS